MPLTSPGLMLAGGIGEGLSKGVDSFLKTRGLLNDEALKQQAAQQHKQQLGLLAAKSGFDVDPLTGEFVKTAEQKEKDEAAMRPLRADSAGGRFMRGLLTQAGAKDVPDDLTEAEAGKAYEALTRAKTAQAIADARLAETRNKRDEARAEKAKLNDKEAGGIEDYDKAITAAKALEPNDEYIGPFEGRLPDVAVGGDEAVFRSKVGRITDAYRKLITGAAASNQEIARLESRLPGVKDTPENFRAKLKGYVTELERNRDIAVQNLKRRGKNVEAFAQPPGLLSSGPSVGDVENGYRFKGGDPAKQESWEKM